jgi:hypothetical protein
MTKERWLPIPSYEGLYEVSDLGRVKSLARKARVRNGMRSVPERILRACRFNKYGHLYVALHASQRGLRPKNFMVHQLVLTTFNGPCPLGQEVRHFPDRDPGNNKLRNLIWGTPAQNAADSIVHGTRPMCETHGMHKLTADQVRFIRVSEWSTVDLGNHFGVHPSTIGDIRRGKTWRRLK